MPPEEKSKSVAQAAEKSRMLRVERLKASLDQRLEKSNAIPSIDALIAEVAEGDPQVALWEKLHGASVRDGIEDAVADAYLKSIDGPRMRRLTPGQQADVIMHAVDFFQGVRGDHATAEKLLVRVVDLTPDRADAFTRLEQRLEKAGDGRRMLELYAKVATAMPRKPEVLATQAMNRLVMLKEPLSDDACRNLLVLVPANAKLLDGLETHCRTTKRIALASDLIERALVLDTAAPDALTTTRRMRLLELYGQESPERAIDSIEWLLERDPQNNVAYKACERLLSKPDVASRAAAALGAARRKRSIPPSPT